jgi:hypothetical protein
MVQVFPWTEAQMLCRQKFAELRKKYIRQTEFTGRLIAATGGKKAFNPGL